MTPLRVLASHETFALRTDVRTETAIDTLIMKVSSRCNLNCDYCYVYNSRDTTWRSQPKFMADDAFTGAIERWKAHVAGRKMQRLHLVLHGGEPLLAGAARLETWIRRAREILADVEIPVSIGLQSNGLLLNDELCSVLDRYSVRVGVSMDGIPGKADQHRVDHAGRPTGHLLEVKLRWLMESKWRHCLGGILSVVNIESDPRETLDYVLGFGPTTVDFRLPLCTHDCPPNRPSTDMDGTSYGRWLARIFDEAIGRDIRCRIRVMDGVINAGRNERAYQNLIGNTELTQACVIECDGSYELPDNLKSTADGMTKTGLHVRTDDMDQFVRFAAAWAGRFGLNQLRSFARACRDCSLYRQCGGYYYANRYGAGREFDNASVYCSDLKFLFGHINRIIGEAS